MAINVYTGLPGSGKSYDVVSEVVVKMLAAGRRVVTNVDGIDGEACADYAVDKLGAEPDKLGSIRRVRNHEVEQANFFPVEDLTVQTVCQAGDIIVIDEAYKFWGTEEKFPKEHLVFFREHRHLAEPISGLTCDLVLMTQDIGDLHRSLKRVVELSVRFKKHKWAGLTKRYVVNVWEGSNQRKPPLSTIQKSYNPEIFPLYSSYFGGRGREGQLDKRQKALGWKFKLAVGACALGFPLSIGGVLWELHSIGHHPAPVVVASSHGGSSTLGAPDAGYASVPGVRFMPADLQSQLAAGGTLERSPDGRLSVLPPRPKDSDTWRLAGFVKMPTSTYVLVADPSGRMREVGPGAFEWVDGRPQTGVVDRSTVTPFTGTLPGVPRPEPSGSSAARRSVPSGGVLPPVMTQASASGGLL